VFILKEVEVLCFDTLLEVLILKGVTLHQNCAKCGLPVEVLILKAVKAVCFEAVLQVLILKELWEEGEDLILGQLEVPRGGRAMARKAGKNLANLTKPL